MKAIVVYYSGTGNNYKIARAIWRGMNEVMPTEIGSVLKVNPGDMGKYDLIGIGSPIWYFREVASVRRFIYQMPDLTGKLGFIFSVHGTMPSGIFGSMVPSLQRKHLTLIGWNDWFGTNYYTLHGPKPYPLDGHPDAEDLQEAEAWGQEIAERAVKVQAGDKSLIPSIPKGKSADPIFQRFGQMTFFPGSEKAHRSINQSKCAYPGCTMCADECPVKAINLKADPPTFNYNTCLNCCLCDHMCPQLAIEIPEKEYYAMHAKKVIDMKKCKYPACTICVDHCSMGAIDFSVNPPVFKKSCEGDDLCWVICPEGAIDIVNMADTHGKMRAPGGPGNAPLEQGKTGAPGKVPPHPMVDLVARREAQGRFRRHIPREEIGKDGRIMDIKRTPRFDIDILMEETPAPVYYQPEKKKKKPD